MKSIKYTITVSVLVILAVCFAGNITAQETEKESSFSINSVGLSLGWYNPSLDYWKEKPEFADASFGGAIHVRGFLDLQLIKNLHGQIGIGYWQSSTDSDLQDYEDPKLLITGVPISLDILYYIQPLEFSVITPYVGAGAEYSFIQNKYNSDPETGSTFIGNGIVGLAAKLSDNFVMDLEFRYKFGSYIQEVFDEPDNPEEILEETIKLDGPYIGLSFRYLF